jgi:hypothetical protein
MLSHKAVFPTPRLTSHPGEAGVGHGGGGEKVLGEEGRRHEVPGLPAVCPEADPAGDRVDHL